MSVSSRLISKKSFGEYSLEFYDRGGKVVALLYGKSSTPQECPLSSLNPQVRHSYETLTGLAKEKIETFLRENNVQMSKKLAGRVHLALNLPFLKATETLVKEGKIDKGLENLYTLLLSVRKENSPKELSRLYTLILELIPKLSKGDFEKLLGERLPRLLERSPGQGKEQLALARLAAERYWGFKQPLVAMRYYSKAIDLAARFDRGALKPLHQKASALFIPIIQKHLVETDHYKKWLEQCKGKGDPKTFEKILVEIERLKEYQCHPGGGGYLKTLYTQAQKVLNAVQGDSVERFAPLSDRVIKGLTDETFPQNPIYITERYRTALKAYRERFVSLGAPTTRALQKKRTQAFITFFEEIFLKDTFAILGAPPCHYDLRAMGSFAREELCPYSDLEWMILIEDENHRTYFQNLAFLINLQLTSLGETAASHMTLFTALGNKHRSGLHIDSGGDPYTSGTIHTPKKMAAYQKPKSHDRFYDPASLEHTLLRSQSLNSSTPELFKAYKKEVDAILNSPLQQGQTVGERRATQILKERLKDFTKSWKKGLLPSINVKEHYVQPLFLLIGDLALYFGCPEANTLDILKWLDKKKIFDPLTHSLLKEMVEKLYHLRVTLHLSYGEQKETLPLIREKELLTKGYFLILSPLYAHLDFVFNTHTQKAPPFAKSLQNLSLLDAAFGQIKKHDAPFSKSLSQPLNAKQQLETLITTLLEKKGGSHRGYYQALSERMTFEPLRELYLDTLLKKGKKALFEELSPIPNRDGTRQSVLRKEKAFHTSLRHLTQENPSPVTIQTPTLGTRYLKEILIPKILDNQGNIKSDYRSAHGVCHLQTQELDLHLKQKPHHPLMEYALYNLASRLAGEGPPPTELARLTVGDKSYPLLLSQTVPGENLDTRLKQGVPPLDPENHTWNLLLAILTRPGDGRAPNYIYRDQKITSVDNDISFAIPIRKGEKTKEAFKRATLAYLKKLPETEIGKPMPYDTINFCSILFTLNPHSKLDPTVIYTFCKLEPDFILKGWALDLQAKEKEYTSLFTPSETKKLYTEDPQQTFTPTLLFRKGEMATLCAQFHHLQETLPQLKNPTAQTLLSTLINLRPQDHSTSKIGPLIQSAYLSKQTTPQERLKQAVGRPLLQSHTSIGAQYACHGREVTDQEISKGLLSIAAAQKELLAYPTFKTIRAIRGGLEIDCSKLENDPEREALLLSSLKINLVRKYTTLRLLNCKTLSSATLAPFLHSRLKVLDLRGSALTTFDQLAQKAPNLEELNLSHCPHLQSIEIPKQEGSFFKSEVPAAPIPLLRLKKLHVSHCSSLTTLRLKAPRLTLFKRSATPSLKKVAIDGINLYDTLRLNQKELKAACLNRGIAHNKRSIERLASQSNLHTLDFSFSPITLEGGQVIAELLKKSPTITTLKLWHVEISPNAMKHIVEGVLTSKAITTFEPVGVPFHPDLEKMVREKLQKNRPTLPASKPPQVPQMAFGPKEWETYFGTVGQVPPLPPNIEEILNSPCPIWSGKKLRETHLLTLIPQTVNGTPLTLKTLQTLIEKPKGNGHATKYRYYYPTLKKDLGDKEVPDSYWILMSHDIIPNSRKKRYSDQKSLVKTLSQKSQKPYTLPKALEAAVTILMNHAHTKRRLYSDKPYTYTRCQETLSDGYPPAIGGFSAGGLVLNPNLAGESEYLGVGVVRKVPHGSG
ncbi:DUF294 nucleotidyltransferase-like domain-containing protein [Candidatus Neptunochlamydia vexilliferae]|nr:DUF294 nucleotidyltransferase-like domain-containing protein [Candidatus Neptunochlamydia vexilliferae]